MSKLFYDHLIVIEEVTSVLDEHELTDDEKHEFIELIDETLHHHILDTVLTHLPEEHHEVFLDKLVKHPHHPDLLHFLKERTQVDIEHEIQKTGEKVKRMIMKDLKESQE
jgi:hypothetical protein